MTSYKHALLALLSSSPITTANHGKVGNEAVISAAASPGELQLEVNDAPSRGAECAHYSHHKKKKIEPKNRATPDVGVLSSNLVTCPGSNEVCRTDETSSLGGRCVARSRRMDEDEDRLQACKKKCPKSKFCDYLYSDMESFEDSDSTQATASACKNKEHQNCLPSYNATIFDALYCPLSKCMIGIEGYDGFMNMNEDDDEYSRIAQDVTNCYNCGYSKNMCGLCKDNDSFIFCVEDEVNDICKEARANKTYHYHQNCKTFMA